MPRALAATLATAVFLVLPSVAKAEDTPPSADAAVAPATDHVSIRAVLIHGRAADARNIIADRLATKISVAERAALLELHTVAMLWDRGRPAPIQTATMKTAGLKWGEELDLARADIGRGAYATAIPRLDRLLSDAPDLVEAARAVELRLLAREALKSSASATVAVVDNDARSPSSDARPAKTSRWYGWQTLIADGGALLATGANPIAGLALYATGAPVIHLIHGNVAKAGASVGLRLAAPVAGGFLGYGLGMAANNGKSDWGVGILAGIGLLAGGVTAIVVDHAVIAREDVAADERNSSSSAKQQQPAPVSPTKAALASIRPNAGPRKEGGFDVGIVGVF